MERKLVTLDDIERRLVGEHRRAYGEWLKHVVQLATGALTLLVALQGQYIPKQPSGTGLLVGGWILLVLAIATGLTALRGENQTPLDAANALRRRRREIGDEGAAAEIAANSSFQPRRVFVLARLAMSWALVLGLVCVAVFAIVNLP